MSEIKTYKKGEFFQINLDDGNKILISIGFSNIKVFKLGFMGLPKKTIWSSRDKKVGRIIYREEALNKLIENIKEFSSLQELEKFFDNIKEKNLEERLLDYGLL